RRTGARCVCRTGRRVQRDSPRRAVPVQGGGDDAVMSMPLVAFNLLYVRPGYAGGTVRYAYELLRQLCHVGRHRYLVYAQAGVFPRSDPELGAVALHELRVRGGLPGRVVTEHLRLPARAAKD